MDNPGSLDIVICLEVGQRATLPAANGGRRTDSDANAGDARTRADRVPVHREANLWLAAAGEQQPAIHFEASDATCGTHIDTISRLASGVRAYSPSTTCCRL